MFKKIVSMALALALVISLVSISVFAGGEKKTVGIDEIAQAVSKDFEGTNKAVSMLGSLSRSLMKNIVPYIENVVLTPDNIEKTKAAATEAMAKLIDKITNPSKPGDPSQPDNPSQPGEPSQPDKDKISIGELKAFLERYIFVKVDDVDAAAMKAIESSSFTYELVTDTDGTVYISIDISKNPEIFNLSVFKKVVEGLYSAQGEELLKNSNGETDYAMSYEHIAGELALHAAVYAVTDGLINTAGTKNELILKLYNKALLAELNYDEARVPSEFMSILGVLIMDLFQFNLLKLFGII